MGIVFSTIALLLMLFITEQFNNSKILFIYKKCLGTLRSAYLIFVLTVVDYEVC